MQRLRTRLRASASTGAPPSLSLDFLGLNQTLDSRITFSRGSNATLVDSTGKVTYAPNNLLTYSQDFDNAAWTKSNATVTANASTAPDGTTTADKLIESAAAGAHAIVQTSTVFDATVYVASAYVKAAERTFVALYAGTVGKGTIFNLSNGTVYGPLVAPPTSSSITPAGNGWYRVSITYTSTSTTSTTAVYLCDETAQFSYTGDGTSGAFIWGAQLEAVTYQTTPGTYNSTSPKNLLGYTQEFDNAAWAKSVLSVTANTATAPDGTLSADKLIADTTTAVHTIGQNIAVVSGTTMTGSVYAKAGEYNFAGVLLLTTFAAPQIVICNLSTGTISSSSGSPLATSITAVGNGWYRISITQVTNATGTATMQVRPTNVGNTTFFTGDGTSGIYVWGAQLSNSASLDPYVYNPGAAPTSTAYYGPRFDYDPVTLNPKGLLIEEQRSNLLTYSEQFDNAAWGKSLATVSVNATASPDGTSNADKLVEDTSSGNHYANQLVTTVASTTYTASVYLKAAGRNARLFVYQSASPFATIGSITVDLSSGAVLSGSGAVANVGNGWYRVSVTGAAVDTATRVRVDLAQGTTLSYTGDGTSGVYLYGAQLEVGAFATSYIPTVASTVTRSADVATMTGTNFSDWYNQSEGTLAAEFATGGLGAINSVVASSDGTATNEIYAYANTTSVLQRVATAGVQQVSSTAGASAANTTYKLAMAYKLNDFAVSLGGAAAVTDTSGTVPTVDRLTIGARGSLSSPLNGHIRRLAYYPTRLADYQLQGLTA